jgi:DNA-binding response OmpR family regulator
MNDPVPGQKGGEDMPGARIVLVEDDEVLRGLLARNLQARGHEVHAAGDARTALAHLRTAPFDLIVLDICLPDQTGWEILRTAQREGWLHPQAVEGDLEQLPVVVLSAVRVSSRRLAEFHPLAYLPKPFPMEAVLRMAAEAAGRRNGGVVSKQGDAESYRNALQDEEELHA